MAPGVALAVAVVSVGWTLFRRRRRRDVRREPFHALQETVTNSHSNQTPRLRLDVGAVQSVREDRDGCEGEVSQVWLDAAEVEETSEAGAGGSNDVVGLLGLPRARWPVHLRRIVEKCESDQEAARVRLERRHREMVMDLENRHELEAKDQMRVISEGRRTEARLKKKLAQVQESAKSAWMKALAAKEEMKELVKKQQELENENRRLRASLGVS
ncbi:hypothetical protein BSKO_11844 [Bryopsis sp. KO-2023]|nr:hypothetical protein BSKO_11844 [Bryopsis sp. KO-2023]